MNILESGSMRERIEKILKGVEVLTLYLASSTSFIAFYTFALAIKVKYFILALTDFVVGVILFLIFCYWINKLQTFAECRKR
jgi:hypothetical protein